MNRALAFRVLFLLVPFAPIAPRLAAQTDVFEEVKPPASATLRQPLTISWRIKKGVQARSPHVKWGYDARRIYSSAYGKRLPDGSWQAGLVPQREADGVYFYLRAYVNRRYVSSAVSRIPLGAEKYQRIEIRPPTDSLKVGYSRSYYAYGMTGPGRFTNITYQGSWTSSDPKVLALVRKPSSFKAIAPGEATVTFAKGTQTVSGKVTVLGKEKVTKLEIWPRDRKLREGSTIYLGCAAYYGSSRRYVTWKAAFKSSDSRVLEPDSKSYAYRFRAAGPGEATVTASFGGLSVSTKVTVVSVRIVDLHLWPPRRQLRVGHQVYFWALGRDAAGYRSYVGGLPRAVWTHDPKVLRRVGGARFEAVGKGTTEVGCKVDDGAGKASCEVYPPAKLVGLSIWPAARRVYVGGNVHRFCRAKWDDGTTWSVYHSVRFKSADQSIVAPGQGLSFRGVKPGVTELVAEYQGLTAKMKVEVVPLPKLVAVKIWPVERRARAGHHVWFYAHGVRDDRSLVSLTRQGEFRSLDLARLGPFDGNRASALKEGKAEVQFVFANFKAKGTVAIHPPRKLVKLEMEPARREVKIGTYAHLHARAHWDDNTSWTVTWNGVWTFDPPGVLSDTRYALRLGETRATVEYGGLKATGTIAVVKEPKGAATSTTSRTKPPAAARLVGLMLFPPRREVLVAQRATFKATALYSNGTRRGVGLEGKWSLASGSIARAEPVPGVYAGLAPGITTVRCEFEGKAASATLVVRRAEPAVVLSRLEMRPVRREIDPRQETSFEAVGCFSDGSRQVVSGRGTWALADQSIGKLNPEMPGQAFGLKPGTTRVTFTWEGKTVSGTLVVRDPRPQVIGLELEPERRVVKAAQRARFRAYATYSDGSRKEVTAEGRWEVEDAAIAGVDGTGTAAGAAPGTTPITFTWKEHSVVGAIVVSKPEVERLVLVPQRCRIEVGKSVSFRAFANFSDGARREVTGSGTWAVSSGDVATWVVGTPGLFRGARPGTTLVRLSWRAKSAEGSLVVAERGQGYISVAGDEMGMAELMPAVNLQLVIDCSRSMNAGIPEERNRKRIEVAREALKKMIALLPDRVRVAIRLFGYRSLWWKNNCKDTRLIRSFRKLDRGVLNQLVDDIKPMGMTPLAYALGLLRLDFRKAKGRKLVVLLSDGDDSCGGDPPAQIRKLVKEGFEFSIHAIGFGLTEKDARAVEQLRGVAREGSGTFVFASNLDTLIEALKKSFVPYYRVEQEGKVVGRARLGERLRVRSGAARVVVEAHRPIVSDVEVVTGKVTVLEAARGGDGVVLRATSRERSSGQEAKKKKEGGEEKKKGKEDEDDE